MLLLYIVSFKEFGSLVCLWHDVKLRKTQLEVRSLTATWSRDLWGHRVVVFLEMCQIVGWTAMANLAALRAAVFSLSAKNLTGGWNQPPPPVRGLMTLFRLRMVKQILPSGRIVSWSPWSSWKFLPSLRSCKNLSGWPRTSRNYLPAPGIIIYYFHASSLFYFYICMSSFLLLCYLAFIFLRMSSFLLLSFLCYLAFLTSIFKMSSFFLLCYLAFLFFA